MDKGEELNRRVWTLFEKAGFQTKPNSQDPSEHVVTLAAGQETIQKPVDLYAGAAELGVTIVGSNKAQPRLRGFSDHLAGLAELRNGARAQAALLVVSEKRMEERERPFAQGRGVVVWDERALAYYEAVAEAIREFAKYEIIHSLGIQTKEEILQDTVLAIRLEQPAIQAGEKVELYMFSLPPDKLLKTCVVLRKASRSQWAYQRILSARRLPKIGAFVNTPDALLPTNIVVHLGASVRVDELAPDLRDDKGQIIEPSHPGHRLVALTIPLRYGSLELVDDQHRLFGFAHSDDHARRNFSLVVVGIRNISEARRSKTFVAINDNARRVDPNLVAYLRYTHEEKICRQNADLMALKIAVELNKNSPFKGAIRMLDIERQRLTLKGVTGYDLRGMIGPRGLLRRHYPNTSRAYVRVLRLYFTLVSQVFNKEWQDPGRYIIATNRGFTAFLKLLKSILRTEQKAVTRPVARRYLAVLKTTWPSWETARLPYVGARGWKEFHRDLVKTVQKQYPSFKE